ncbi:MAG: hypothetical protein JEZ04_14005 [Spirochaetales bacterium]|nr:hypothetical protein [Spirochaetales bacterium]
MKINKIIAFSLLTAAALLLTACPQPPVSDYQAFMQADPQRVVMILNGSSENFSGLDPVTGAIYNNLQLVGHSGTNSAVPSDIIASDGKLSVLLSGQNSVEGYNITTLDYLDEGRHYFKNGYNPMAFIPVPGKNWAFIGGLETDEIQIVNLDDAGTDYSFVKSFSEVILPEGSNQETKASPTLTNAVGDNHKRGSTGGTVLSEGAFSYLYVTNVRYDSSILLTEGGELADYPPSSGSKVSSGGYFREATLSIFSFNSGALSTGASDAAIAFQLVKELSLEDILSAKWPDRTYYPGDGLNPQSAFILGGRLNIICTGTNGGAAKTFTSGEYIPAGYSAGDVKPGTDPDDGVILVFDISSPDEPVCITHLEIGGSPVGFREGIDKDRKIVYLAGVGGVQSYRYGQASDDYAVLHSSSSMLLTAEAPDTDYYSGLCYDESDGVIYISFYSGDELKSVNVTGSAEAPVYSVGSSWQTGDGPGMLAIINRD